jgi:hypothetical protein
VEEGREEARYKKLKTEVLAQAKKHQQKELSSHVKQALHERHEKALQQAKEEYNANARALVEKEHRAEVSISSIPYKGASVLCGRSSKQIWPAVKRITQALRRTTTVARGPVDGMADTVRTFLKPHQLLILFPTY